MKLFLTNREQLQALGSFLVSELDSMVARIRGAWNVEHNDDDTHGHVHAESTATGRLVFSDIAEADIAAAQVDNYAPGGLSTASLLRLQPTVDTPVITGIQVPQDESGVVLDGRVLVIENTSTTYALSLQSESTASFPRNRFNLPWLPIEGSAFHVNARTLIVLIYNATLARWVVQSQSNETAAIYAEIGTSQNDWLPTGFRAAGVVRVSPTAASLTITGIDVTAVPAPSKKLLRNDGLYTIALAHSSTSSVAANRIRCPGGVQYLLNPRESVELYHEVDSVGWKLVASGKADQWVDVTFAAGNSTTDTGTWTVAAGDQTTYAYQIDGNRMTVSFDFRTTTVATNPTQLRIAVPAGRTIARTMSNPLAVAVNAGTQISTAYVEALAGNAYLRIFRDVAATAWGAATDTTRVTGQITFMVQDAAAGISESHTDTAHGDTAHSDAEHSDVAHVDVAHSDSHSDSAHTDSAHADVAHVDTAHSDVAHVDDAHSDTHSDSAHSDTAHSDTAHSDSHNDTAHVDTHGDEAHNDSEFGGPPFGEHGDSPHSDEHTDAAHVDVHEDVSHSDTAHTDAAHSDSHSDAAHSDTAHSDTAHVDTAHVDSAHVDTGHSDSHSDTPAHADTAHADVAHGDTAHSDAVHQDVGYHTDANHSDI